mmetsp:Transcript_140226/g.364467  ORF Transcript_140226/g.364467 Transcript_140226/m.364467 type:complete len:308 (-) Transcript_140226:171-1094(-)
MPSKKALYISTVCIVGQTETLCALFSCICTMSKLHRQVRCRVNQELVLDAWPEEQQDRRNAHAGGEADALAQPEGMLSKPRRALGPHRPEPDGRHTDCDRDCNVHPRPGRPVDCVCYSEVVHDRGHVEERDRDGMEGGGEARRVHEKEAIEELERDQSSPDEIQRGRVGALRIRQLAQHPRTVEPHSYAWPSTQSRHRASSRSRRDEVTDAEARRADRTRPIPQDPILATAADKHAGRVPATQLLGNLHIAYAAATLNLLGWGLAQVLREPEDVIEEPRQEREREQEQHEESRGESEQALERIYPQF